MGTWKSGAKQDGVKSQGPSARNSGKSPFPTTGTTRQNAKAPYREGGSQENPRRQRRQDYTPTTQPRPKSVRY